LRVWREGGPARFLFDLARLSAALLDQLGTTVKPGKLEVPDIDDAFCAAHGDQ
jgi:hypothetical protein